MCLIIQLHAKNVLKNAVIRVCVCVGSMGVEMGVCMCGVVCVGGVVGVKG